VVRPGHVAEKKGQDWTDKKSQSGNTSPVWGEATTVPIKTKMRMVGSLRDIITCAKFQDIFRGYDFTGVQFPIFLLIFCMGLTTVQHYCAACDNNNKQVLQNNERRKNNN